MSLPPSANSRDRWLDLANEARDKAREALTNGDRRTAELWDEHERTLLRNAYEDVPHPDDGAPATDGAPTGTLQDLIGTLADDPDLALPRSVADGEGVQVAGDESAAMWPGLAAAGLLGAAEMARQQDPLAVLNAMMKQRQEEALALDKKGKEIRKRGTEGLPSGSLSTSTDPVQPIQIPGFPGDQIDLGEGNIETLPAEPIVVEGEVFPADEPAGGMTFVFPNLSNDLPQISIVENRGNRYTKAELDRLRDRIQAAHPDWKHIAGGRNAEGAEMKEYWIPGPGKAFLDENEQPGDGRPGGRFVDLTFRTPSGKLVHFQTVDVDRNGKPTQREIDAAEAIRRARYDKDREIPKNEPAPDVYLVPKLKRRY